MSPALKLAVQNRRLVGRERIVHHHVGNRRIALVGHRQRVVDDVAGRVRRAVRYRRVLLDVQDLVLRNRNRGSSVSGVAPVPVTVAVLTMAVPASSSACVT